MLGLIELWGCWGMERWRGCSWSLKVFNGSSNLNWQYQIDKRQDMSAALPLTRDPDWQCSIYILFNNLRSCQIFIMSHVLLFNSFVKSQLNYCTVACKISAVDQNREWSLHQRLDSEQFLDNFLFSSNNRETRNRRAFAQLPGQILDRMGPFYRMMSSSRVNILRWDVINSKFLCSILKVINWIKHSEVYQLPSWKWLNVNCSFRLWIWIHFKMLNILCFNRLISSFEIVSKFNSLSHKFANRYSKWQLAKKCSKSISPWSGINLFKI